MREIEISTLNLPKKTFLGPNDFTKEFYQTFNEQLTIIIYHIFQKINEGNIFELILLGQFYSNIKTRQRHYKNKNYRLIFAHEFRCENIQESNYK